MHQSRQLRRPRVTGLKAVVPGQVKALPKALQGLLLTGAAGRLRRNVETSGSVFVSSWPRSGSTWLFEMLASDRSLLPVFEPFHPTQNPFMLPYADALGFLAEPEPDESAQLRALVEEICTGRRLTRWSSNRAPRDRILKAPRTLVKEVRVGSALPWLTSSFPDMATVALLRHPCAVIESILRTPGEWQEWPDEQILETLFQYVEPDLVERLRGAERLELLTALWATSANAALTAARQGDSTCVVTYEELVREPDDVLGSLADLAGLADVSADPERLSLHTHRTSPLHEEVSDRLSMWRDRLDASSVARILDVANLLGIGFYSQDSYPDRVMLAAAVASEGDGEARNS